MAKQFDNLSPYTFITEHLIRDTKSDAKPLICIRPEDPKDKSIPWIATALDPDISIPENANLYICASSCNRQQDNSSKFHGQYRATLDCASALHMFMLDDLSDGTDPDAPNYKDLPIDPSWTIETSPNNYQCIFSLTEPLEDIPFANQITKLLAQSANTDTSAINAVRWIRLPGGINNKAAHINKDGEPWVVTIADSNPDLVYTVQEIIGAFNLELPDLAQSSENNAPIITGVEPEGFARHVSALLSIPPECDYQTWFNCIVVMHSWGEQGFVVVDEWSKASTDPDHSNVNVRAKWDAVAYDSKDPKGHTSVLSWPWLQSEARRNGWDYNQYSAEHAATISKRIVDAASEKELNDIIHEIHDSFFCNIDLEQVLGRLQNRYKEIGVNIHARTLKSLVTATTELPPDDEQWSYPLTDNGNLLRVATLFDSAFYVIPQTNEYIQWNNNRWEWVKVTQHLAREAIHMIPMMEQQTVTQDQHRQLLRWRNNCGSNNRISALEKLVKNHTDFHKTLEQLNTHRTIIGMPNGLCNLQSGLISADSPDHLITMHTRYDVDKQSDCPRWKKFISEIMNHDAELSRFIQKLAGYALYGGNPEQLFVVLEGHGANGKTVFVNTLEHVMGDYAATASADTLTRPGFNKSGSAAAPDLVRLFRKRLVLCNEWEEGKYLNEPLIKILTGGGDKMAVRALYSNHTIEYSPEFLILLATNHKPNIASMDFGIWRRLLIIPFEVNFTDAKHIATRDPHLEQFFRDHEGPGILNWMIEGYHLWREEGMGADNEATLPKKLYDIKKDFKHEMDTIGLFLNECTVNHLDHPDEIPDDDIELFKIKSAELYRTYKNWTAENGQGAKGSKTFSQAIIQRGFGKTRVGTGNGFKGIKIKSPSEILADEPRTIGTKSNTTDKQATKH